MTEHTPTPWSYRTTYDNNEPRDEFTLFHRGTIIADVQVGFLESDETDEANLAHIVKCVNLHDELVGALLTLRDMMYVPDVEARYMGNVPPLPANERMQALHLCWDALAKAVSKP